MKPQTFSLTVVDISARTPAEAQKRFVSLSRMTLPTLGYKVIEARAIQSPAPAEPSNAQLDMEFDRITDPHGFTEGIS